MSCITVFVIKVIVLICRYCYENFGTISILAVPRDGNVPTWIPVCRTKAEVPSTYICNSF
jgi:hypothetical protein